MSRFMSQAPHNTDEPAEPRRRGVDPMSQATRKRLLGKLLAAADAGDPQAAGVLIELSLAAERDERLGEALEQLKAGDTEGEG